MNKPTPGPFIESLYVSIDSANTGKEPPQNGKHLGWGKWHRVAEQDGSTIAYCPDVVTARLIAQAPALLEFVKWVTRCAAITMPHGIKAYAISDEQMEKARTILKNLNHV